MSETRILPIPNFPYYLAGDDGTIWSIRHKGGNDRRGGKTSAPHKMKQNADRNGYMQVSLDVDGRVVTCKVHTLVLQTFIGPCPDGKEACHFPDEDHSNNRLTNLRWDTHSENMRDRFRNLVGEGTRICTRCEQNKSSDLFYEKENSIDGRISVCKECYSKINSEQKAKGDKEQRRIKAKEYMRKIRASLKLSRSRGIE